MYYIRGVSLSQSKQIRMAKYKENIQTSSDKSKILDSSSNVFLSRCHKSCLRLCWATVLNQTPSKYTHATSHARKKQVKHQGDCGNHTVLPFKATNYKTRFNVKPALGSLTVTSEVQIQAVVRNGWSGAMLACWVMSFKWTCIFVYLRYLYVNYISYIKYHKS